MNNVLTQNHDTGSTASLDGSKSRIHPTIRIAEMPVMKTLHSIIFWMISGAMLSEVTVVAQEYDFIFSLKNALDPQAEKYVIEKTNIKIFHEPFYPQNSYWGVEKNDIPARLTFRFPLERPMLSGRMYAGFDAANFANSKELGSGKGSVSLWCSKNGIDWILLKDLPAPTSRAFDGDFFNNRLPKELTGSTEIWLQVRMEATGMRKPTYSVAQFCRDNRGDPNGKSFDIRVRYKKPKPDFVSK